MCYFRTVNYRCFNYCQEIFVSLIFVSFLFYGNILTTKLSQITVPLINLFQSPMSWNQNNYSFHNGSEFAGNGFARNFSNLCFMLSQMYCCIVYSHCWCKRSSAWCKTMSSIWQIWTLDNYSVEKLSAHCGKC